MTSVHAGAEKPRVLTAVKEGGLIPFALKAYAPGHKATDFDKWYTATEAYAVDYTPNFEPWYITKREHMFMYDARFRGYGWNKVTQVGVVNRSTFMCPSTALKLNAHSAGMKRSDWQSS